MPDPDDRPARVLITSTPRGPSWVRERFEHARYDHGSELLNEKYGDLSPDSSDRDDSAVGRIP